MLFQAFDLIAWHPTEIVASAGGGGALALAITLLAQAIGRRRNGNGRTRYAKLDPVFVAKFDKTCNRIDALYDWHDVSDPTTGAKVWYSGTTVQILGVIAKNQDTQLELQRDMNRHLYQITNAQHGS